MNTNNQLLYTFIIGFIFNLLFSQECPPTDTLVVSAVQNSWNFPTENQWDQVEVMTWNLKEFPYSNSTVNNVQEAITDILPDIIALQEINDGNAFLQLANSLPAYEFVSSGSGLALAARRDVVEILNQSTLFPSSGYEFAWRYPFKVDLQWGCGLSSITLSVIVVHLKAGSTSEDANRRFESCEELEGYVVSHLNDNIIILGDYNDEITDPESNNSLWPLVNSNSVEFTTESIANIDYYSTYPSWPSFIDHISVSEQLFDEMVGSSIKTIRIDDYTGYTNFQNNFSDHRPVIWSFSLDEIDVPTGLVINEIMQNPSAVSDTYGEWIEVTNIGNEVINLDGLILHEDGSESHTINVSGGLFLLPQEFIVLGINDDLSQNGGIIVDYEYSDFFLSNNWDEVIISHPTGIIIDQISYDNGISFPDESGKSMGLNSPLNDNSLGENWIVSINQLSAGDYGTPGASNNTEGCSESGDGDVNNDGILNVLDLVSIIQFILGETDFSESQSCSADKNYDSLINILDIVQIISDILDN
jgi:exonuclease III